MVLNYNFHFSPCTEIHSSEVDLICIFPKDLDCDKKALVCLYVPYDHVSDSCESFHPPPKPDYLQKGETLNKTVPFLQFLLYFSKISLHLTMKIT